MFGGISPETPSATGPGAANQKNLGDSASDAPAPRPSTRLVQLSHPEEGRRAALVYQNELHLLATYRSVYQFALAALDTGWTLRDLLSTDLSGVVLEYDEVHSLQTPWRFLPAFEHPREPGSCLVAGLTEAGWEYRGSGESLTAHGEPLPIPEPGSAIRVPELAAAYVIGYDGAPRRVGIAAGIRAPSFSALGPELILELSFGEDLEGSVGVRREGQEIWNRNIRREVSSPVGDLLAAVEPEHFRRAGHRSRGNAHVCFFGSKLLTVDSPGVEDGDELIVEFGELGRALRAAIRVEEARPVTARPL